MGVSLNRVPWTRILARGVLWAVVYNLLWAVAWRALMRNEWDAAAAAIGQPSPGFPQVWWIWTVITVPIGVAIIAYAVSRSQALRAAAVGGAGAWIVLALGVTINFSQQGYPARVLILDAIVNLVAMETASLVGAWRVNIPQSSVRSA